MEFIFVTVSSNPQSREVYANGGDIGQSYQLMQIDAGSYVFTLQPPNASPPASVAAVVSNTSPVDPMIIRF